MHHEDVGLRLARGAFDTVDRAQGWSARPIGSELQEGPLLRVDPARSLLISSSPRRRDRSGPARGFPEPRKLETLCGLRFSAAVRDPDPCGSASACVR